MDESFVNREFSFETLSKSKLSEAEQIKKLFDVFSLNNENWYKFEGFEFSTIDSKSTFIFRGQSSSSWSLIPSSHRGGWEKLIKGPEGANFLRCFKPNKNDRLDRLRITAIDEYTAVFEFLKLADKEGFEIPHVGEIDKNLYQEIYNLEIALADPRFRIDYDFEDDYVFKTEDVLSRANALFKEISDIFLNSLSYSTHIQEFAFAQHYGIPTRLLDWTKDPFVALFFAAMGLFENDIEDAQDFSIWCYDSEAFTRKGVKPPIDVIQTTYNENINIRNQSGVFSKWDGDFFAFMKYGKWLGHEEAISEAVLSNDLGEGRFIKYDISKQLVKPILKGLYRLGYTTAFIKPSLENVRRTCEFRNKVMEDYDNPNQYWKSMKMNE